MEKEEYIKNQEKENYQEVDKTNKKEKEDLSPEEKINDLEDKLTRYLAEMENQRRRFEKEKEDAFEYGGFTLARESLNLIDHLERLKQSLINDESLKDTDAFKKISEHLDIIYSDIISIFKKNNIEPIKSINVKLDPNLHQAMMEIEDNTKEAGTIVQEIQKGFMMKERLLRPSLVGVSKKDNSKPEEKIKELEDKITRTLAEMENQRRRFEKEKEDAFEYGGFSFARESLALIDNLERAKESIQNDSEIKDNKILKKAVNHLEIIKKDLLSIFKKNNIEKIESINKKLDPNLHQAMIEIENNEKESGTIIQEIQKGFIMKDRLLRPALVGVAKSSNKKEKTKNFKENEENKDKNKENNEQ